MELGGDEKRIQALFSELSFEDVSRVPQFGHLWSRAQVNKETSGIGRPVAVLVSLLVTAAACSFAVWSWYRSTETPNILVQLPPTVEATYTPTPIKLEPARPARPARIYTRHQKHITHRQAVDRSIATEAALLSTWQSPTQQFMASPTDLALGSLPALNQSAKDFESFLSKNSEIMKESNR